MDKISKQIFKLINALLQDEPIKELAHDLRGLGVSEGWSPSDALNIGHLGGLCGFSGQFDQLAHLRRG